MKAVVLGGTGDMGSLAVHELGRDERIEQVTIVGRNREQAEVQPPKWAHAPGWRSLM